MSSTAAWARSSGGSSVPSGDGCDAVGEFDQLCVAPVVGKAAFAEQLAQLGQLLRGCLFTPCGALGAVAVGFFLPQPRDFCFAVGALLLSLGQLFRRYG